MSSIEERKNDRVANLLRAELAKVNDEAAEASIAMFSYTGTDLVMQRAEDVAVNAVDAMRWVYALYVTEGGDHLSRLHDFADKASAGVKARLMTAYLNIKEG